MAQRRFTLAEAESLLPRLTELILQLQERKQEHEQSHARVWELEQKMGGNGHLAEEALNAAQREMARAVAEVNSLVQKVEALGCELKDIDQGLVDFRIVMEEREVYLCWKLGEPSIGWWHELEMGFAGRRPLPGLP